MISHFSGYEMSYKVEKFERKYLTVQLEVSKLSIKNFFGNLLNETKGSKYQITVKILSKITSLMEKLNSLQYILSHGKRL